MPIEKLTPVRKMSLDVAKELVIRLGPSLLGTPMVQKALLGLVEGRFASHYERLKRTSPLPPGVIEERELMTQAFLHTVARALARRQLSQAMLRGLVEVLLEGALIRGGDREAQNRFREKYGTRPPGLLTISPGKACNLHCPGCWADAGKANEKLDFATVDRIIREAEELWGARFFVLTGGEPMAYRSEGHDILDLVARHPQSFFLMYTNGTLIDERAAARMGELGNITPAVSLEGFRQKTDARRGIGVFDKCIAAMARLRKHGVLFGISLTATRYNYREIMSDEFLDFCFEQQGALYGWIFQYMPIGRSITLNLMPTPEQRLWMWKRTCELARTRHYFFADFWNQGTVTEGCIAAGRSTGGGYMYIDWNGNVTPCVFMPYSPVNVKEVFAQGGNMNDVWAQPFFEGIRSWQRAYREKGGNWLMPCPNRDHHAELRRIIAEHEPEPIDPGARQALLDPDYAKGLAEYDATYANMTEGIWKERYLQRRA